MYTAQMPVVEVLLYMKVCDTSSPPLRPDVNSRNESPMVVVSCVSADALKSRLIVSALKSAAVPPALSMLIDVMSLPCTRAIRVLL